MLLQCLDHPTDPQGQLILLRSTASHNPLEDLLNKILDEPVIIFSPSPIAQKRHPNTVVCWNLTAPIMLIEIMLKELDVRFFFLEGVPLLLEHQPLQRISGIKHLSLRFNCVFIFLMSSDKIPHHWKLKLACSRHIDLRQAL